MGSERFLVDTTVWVRYLRGADQSLRDRLAPLITGDKVATCEIVVLEILRGARSEAEYRMLRDDLLSLHILPVDRLAWETSWETGRALRQKGLTIPLADLVILSVAKRHGFVLLHSDKHFTLAAGHVQGDFLEI
jgi:hypothetical protein